MSNGQSGAWRPSRLPPAGDPIPWRTLLDCPGNDRAAAMAADIAARLEDRFTDRRVALVASGRAALVTLFRHLAASSGRSEVLVPAYTCYSVPAAAVAAGLSVRLVDVDGRGRIDGPALATADLANCAAVLVSNLFGVAEPITGVRDVAEAAGVAVIDDAAQSLGARDREGVVGGRADYGILSFGRGKPVSALGGGAVVSRQALSPDPPRAPATSPAPLVLARRAAYQVALAGPVFRVLASIPALGIGETEFDPAIRCDPIAAGAVPLLEDALAQAARRDAARRDEARRLSERIEAETAWQPILPAGDGIGVHPRLGLIAPSHGAREAALAALTTIGAGASALYPDSLDNVPALASHLAAPAACPAARDLAGRVLTLPTHGRLRGARLDATIQILARSPR